MFRWGGWGKRCAENKVDCQIVLRRSVEAWNSDSWSAFEATIPEIESCQMWAPLLKALADTGRPKDSVGRGFHTLWTVRGHRIREQVANDSILPNVLRALLPSYGGGPLQLFRGENLGRWNRKKLGFSWTTHEDVARMFARGLNAMCEGGGALLTTFATVDDIIAGPGQHSIYLGEYEYVVDWQSLNDVCCLDTFPEIR